MMEKLEIPIKADKRRKLDVVLIVQAPFLWAVVVAISRIEITPERLMGSSFLLVFYWLYLLCKRIIRMVSIVDANAVDEFGDSRGDFLSSYRAWTIYIGKARKVSTTVTIGVLAYLLVSGFTRNFSRDIFLMAAFIDVLAFFLSYITAIRSYLTNLMNVSIQKSTVRVVHSVQRSLVKSFLVGYGMGMGYLLVIYKVFEMSSLHYFLYFFAFSNLFALSLFLGYTYSYFWSCVRSIDSSHGKA